MDALDATIKPVLVHWRIPILLWLRLMWLEHLQGAPADRVVVQALNAGLDALEVPGTLDELVDAQGDLRIPEVEV